MVVGVAGGIGKYLGVDPTWVRLIFLALATGGGAGILIYLICAFVIPLEPKTEGSTTVSSSFETTINEVSKTMKEQFRNNNPQMRGGIILIAIGALFLLQGYYSWASWSKIWPLILIIIGLSLIVSPRGRRSDNNDKSDDKE